MKIKTIASGSKGNCSLIISSDTKVLIDIGISYLALQKSLERDFFTFNDIIGVLITHSHADHIKGLATLIKKTNILVFIPPQMYEELKHIVPEDRCIFLEDNDKIGSINIELIHTSHDTECSVGYIFENEGKRIVYVTDTGYINRKYLQKMVDANIYILESNHDEEMLMNGPYPYFLKQRVVSDRGHLSNKTTAQYLKKIVGKNTKYVVLAHISEKNNTEELAFDTTRSRIEDANIEVLIARQEEESPLLEV